MDYYKLNKLKIAERKKQYYNDNKDKIYARLNYIKCECGGFYSPNHQEKHNATKAHCKIYNYKIDS